MMQCLPSETKTNQVAFPQAILCHPQHHLQVLQIKAPSGVSHDKNDVGDTRTDPNAENYACGCGRGAVTERASCKHMGFATGVTYDVLELRQLATGRAECQKQARRCYRLKSQQLAVSFYQAKLVVLGHGQCHVCRIVDSGQQTHEPA